MKARTHITPVFLVLMVILGAAGLVAGCHGSHGSHGTIATRRSGTCLDCRFERQTMPGTGISHATCTCPSCQSIPALDESTLAALERYVGGQAGDTVQTCARCESVGINS